MGQDFRGAYREFTVETIFAPEFHVDRPGIIWRTRAKEKDGIRDPQNEELIQIAERGINIVSSRDVRRNVRKSLEIAVDLVAEGKRVLYVNSYAGLNLLREALREQLTRYPDLANVMNAAETEDSIEGEVESMYEDESIEDGVESMNEEDESTNEEGDETNVDDEEDDFYSALPFTILDCKMGMWEPCSKAVRRCLTIVKTVPDPKDPENEVEQHVPDFDAIIFNSYEFSAFEYSARVLMSEQLLRWTRKYPMTFILFTQTVRSTMAAGVPVRGPLGLLTSWAETVAIMDSQLNGKSIIHENNMQLHEKFPPSKKIKLWYNGGGRLDLVEYPKNYRGHRYDLAFFPLHLMDSIPEGIDAVQIVGTPPPSAFQ